MTRLVLNKPNDWANTMSDCIPAAEMLGRYWISSSRAPRLPLMA
ncbi:hypothetical protein GCM10017752_00350 [Streptomyces roseoviridis]